MMTLVIKNSQQLQKYVDPNALSTFCPRPKLAPSAIVARLPNSPWYVLIFSSLSVINNSALRKIPNSFVFL